MPLSDDDLAARLAVVGNLVIGDEAFATRPIDVGAAGLDFSKKVTNGGGFSTGVVMTQAEYDALSIKDPSTAYFIVG